jgi:hypothetical protein
VGLGIAQSNPPTPSGRETGQIPKQVTEADKNQASILQKGTEDSPLIIRLKKTPTDEAEARQETEKRNGDSTSVRWTMVFTGLQAFFALSQVILFWWQLGQIRDSLKHAKDSADAARVSAKAAEDNVTVMKDGTETQLRAYVSFSLKHISQLSSTKGAELDFECINHGQTPAKDVEFQTVVVPLPADTNTLPAFHEGWHPKRMNLFPSGEQHATIFHQTDAVFSEEERRKIVSGQSILVVGIVVQYWDVFGHSHITQSYHRITGHISYLNWLTHLNPFADDAGKDLKPEFVLIPGGNQFS